MAKFLLKQARRRDARVYAELVVINNPKNPTELLEAYRNLAAQSSEDPKERPPMDPEAQADQNAQGMIRLALALRSPEKAKWIAQRHVAAKLVRRFKKKAEDS